MGVDMHTSFLFICKFNPGAATKELLNFVTAHSSWKLSHEKK
jgi:hypothetical protein